MFTSDGIMFLMILILGTLCLILMCALYILFGKYEALYEEIVQQKSPEFVLPKFRNEMYEKVQEDQKVREEKQILQDFLDILRTGECNENDLKKYGEATDG